MFEVKNPSLEALNAEVLKQRMDATALQRIVFRLNWLEDAFKRRNLALKEGVARLDPELFMTNGLIQDLVDVLRESVSLIVREEQGMISPPNAEATAPETPPVAVGDQIVLLAAPDDRARQDSGSL